MNDPRRFKAPFIPKERIWQAAEGFRAAHPAGRRVPVEVLELAEFDLGLELIPAEGLREQLEIDALLMGNLRSILVDRGEATVEIEDDRFGHWPLALDFEKLVA